MTVTVIVISCAATVPEPCEPEPEPAQAPRWGEPGWDPTSPAITAVESAVLAMRMAMRVSGIPVGDDFVTGIIREVTRRERKKSVRKKQGVTFRLVSLVNVKWGDVGAIRSESYTNLC